MPRTRAALGLNAERPKLVQNLPTGVHHSLSSCSPSGHVYPFWLEDGSLVKHPDSLRLSPRAAFGLQQRKIFFSFLALFLSEPDFSWSVLWSQCWTTYEERVHITLAPAPLPPLDGLRTPDPLINFLSCLIKAEMPQKFFQGMHFSEASRILHICHDFDHIKNNHGQLLWWGNHNFFFIEHLLYLRPHTKC